MGEAVTGMSSPVSGIGTLLCSAELPVVASPGVRRMHTRTSALRRDQMAPVGFDNKVAFVWKVADKLRGTFKQHEYGSVMLPLLVLRRMDAVLAPTKDAVVAEGRRLQGHRRRGRTYA